MLIWQHSNFAREPITPPPDYEADIAQDRELEKQSRKSLLDAGCPPCYPPELEFPLQNVLEEYEVVSYWQSLSDTGRVVLTAQLSDWEDFRKYQRDIRRHYLHWKTFGDFEEKVRDRRRRHGLEGDAFLHPELEKQSQLHNWIEFQNYHLQLHERYEKDLKGKTEELDAAREKLETSRLEDPTVVDFFEMGVKNHRNKLEEHKKMLLWIEQQRKAMATEQATSLQAPGDHDRLSIMLTRPSPRRRKTDKARRSPLGPVRTAVSKQPVSPRKQTSSRLQKSGAARVAGSVIADSDEPQSSARLADVEDKSSRRSKDSTPLRPFRPQRVAKPAKNSHAHKARYPVKANTNAGPKPQLKARSKRRKAPQQSASKGVKTRSGRVSRRPERLGFDPARYPRA